VLAKWVLTLALSFMLAVAAVVPSAYGGEPSLPLPEQVLLPLPEHLSLATFSDLDESHWASSVVSLAAAAGLFQGYPDGRFRPSTTITRAEFLAVLMRAYPLKAPAGIIYLEIPTEHWAYELIHRAD